MFLWFVSLQFNDVDSVIWISGYGIASLLSFATALSFVSKHWRLPIAIYATMLLVWIISLLPSITGQWRDGEVERELGGLVITLAVQLFTLRFVSLKSRL
jgi:hypothetical protein